MITTIVFFCLAIRYSVGNVVEINKLLSVDSEIERQSNYDVLVEKWGKWYIVGDGRGVMDISFINIPKALFFRTYDNVYYFNSNLFIVSSYNR